MGMFDWLMPQQQPQTGLLGEPSGNPYLDAMMRPAPSGPQVGPMSLLGLGMGMLTPDARGNGMGNAMNGFMQGMQADTNSQLKALETEKARRSLLATQAYIKSRADAGQPLTPDQQAAIMANPGVMGEVTKEQLVPKFQSVEPGQGYGTYQNGRFTMQGQMPYKPEMRAVVDPSTGAESQEFVSLPQNMQPGSTMPVGGSQGMPNGLGGGFGANGVRPWPSNITKLGPGQQAALTKEGTETGADAALFESIKSKMPGLINVVSKLDELSGKATYTMAGQGLDFAMRESGMNPREAAVARAEYTAIVDNQILPLLRDTFGAQFTEREGQTLRKTLGDPDKTPQEKQAVLKAFIEQKQRDVSGLASRVGRSYEPLPMPKIGGQKEVPAQKDRKIGDVYQTPKGPMKWLGNGWQPVM